jgi:CubicO group peptidase (beta-lactamase class C family)
MPDGKSSGGGLFFLRPRDMAKIGLLMLNNGIQNGTRIVSRQWVQHCNESKIKLQGPFEGYGYLWWKQTLRNDVSTYFADGNGGQQIFIIPVMDMVVVFTAGNENTSVGLQNFQIMNEYVLAAIK